MEKPLWKSLGLHEPTPGLGNILAYWKGERSISGPQRSHEKRGLQHDPRKGAGTEPRSFQVPSLAPAHSWYFFPSFGALFLLKRVCRPHELSFRSPQRNLIQKATEKRVPVEA